MIPVQEVTERMQSSGTVNKHQLALQTLSTLLRQHHQNQDLSELLRTFVLSVSGQFRIPNVFVDLIAAPVELPNQLTFFGIGQFRKCQTTIAEHTEAIIKKFGTNRDVLSDADWSTDEADCPLEAAMESLGVHVILAFRHDAKVVGLLGLGSRPPDGRYSEEDIEVLTTYAASITPFIGDLFLLFTLADVNRRHANILNATKQAIMVFDRTGCLVMLNEAANQMLVGDGEQSSASSLIGMSHRLLFPPHSFPQWHKLMTEAVTNSNSRPQGIVTSDVTNRIYRVNITLLDDKDSQQSDFVVVMDDITEQKHREDQLLSMQMAAEKGYMTASIAHEINNFVSVLIAGAELAAHQLKKGRADEVIQDLELLIDKAARLERYSKGLIDKHRLDTSFTQESINDLIRGLIPFVEAQNRFAKMELKLELDPSLPKIKMDSDQITQVLLNMLNNAADAIFDAKRTDGVITISTSRIDGNLLIQIKDNGIGIEAHHMNQLFKEQFTSKENGHGYGMMLCEKIIANHSGTISVNSTIGVGTAFVISLPI